jgi:3-hydroxy-D-aspartate aldolase
MDADYGRILDKDGKRIDKGEWENAQFILTSVMSHAKADKAIVDAGSKAQSVDSGLPAVFGRTDVKYVECSGEHGVVEDLGSVLRVNDKLRLVPGHCDPTCNVQDWYVGVRGGKVEVVWPVWGQILWASRRWSLLCWGGQPCLPMRWRNPSALVRRSMLFGRG